MAVGQQGAGFGHAGAVLGTVSKSYLGQVATRCSMNDSQAASTLGWNCRTVHYARDTIVNPQLILTNYSVTPVSGIVLPGGTRTSTASFEYPLGTIAGQVKFGGASSVVEANGATTISDPCAGVVIPAGSLFATRHYQVNQTNLCFQGKTNGRRINLALGDRVNNSGVDLTMGGTIVDNGGGSMVAPQGIIAMTSKPSIGIVGSSRTVGLGDLVVDSTGNTGYTRLFGDSFAYMDYGISGDQIIAIAGAAGASRIALINSYCSHFWIDPGLNDLNAGGKTAAQVMAAVTSLATSSWNKPLSRVIVNDEAAWTTSTDGWTTTANQAVVGIETRRVTLNTSINGLSGYNQIVSPNPFDGNGTNFQFFNNPVVGGFQFTADGVHENSQALVAMAAAGLFNPSLVHL